MNKIYKIKWDIVKSTWIVCSELCATLGKSCSISIAPAIVVGGLLFGASQAKAGCESSDTISYVCTESNGFPLIIEAGVDPKINVAGDITVNVERNVSSDGFIYVSNNTLDTSKTIRVNTSGSLITSAPFINNTGLHLVKNPSTAIQVIDFGIAGIEVQQDGGVIDGNQAGMILSKSFSNTNTGGGINFTQKSGILRGGMSGLVVAMKENAGPNSTINLSFSGDVIAYADSNGMEGSTYDYYFKGINNTSGSFADLSVKPAGVYVAKYNPSSSVINLTQLSGLIKGEKGILIQQDLNNIGVSDDINIALASQVDGTKESGVEVVNVSKGRVIFDQMSGAISGATNGILLTTPNASVTTQGTINGATYAGVSVGTRESFFNSPRERHSGQFLISQKSGVISGGKYGILLQNLGTVPAELNISSTVKASDKNSFTERLSPYSMSSSKIALGMLTKENTKGYSEAIVDGGTAIVINSDIGTGANINLNSGANISSDAGIAIRSGAGNETLNINRGATVSGDIVLGGGSDTLIVNGGANIDEVSLLDGGSSKYVMTDVTLYSKEIKNIRTGKVTLENKTTKVLQEDQIANDSVYTNKLFFNGMTYASPASLFKNWQTVNFAQSDVTFTNDAFLVTGNGLNSDNSLQGLVLNSSMLKADALVNIVGDVYIDESSLFSHKLGGTITGNVVNAGQVLYENIGHELTINGDYISNGGIIYLDSQLYDDSSQTDKLIVNGDTSGTTTMFIRNIGGIGTPTLEGIELVHVSGQSNGEFSQSGRLVAGAYDYFLNRGQGERSKNWYLTSRLLPVDPEPMPVDPEPTIKPVNQPTIRPEAGSYIHNHIAENTMFITRLHDRLGETRYIDELTGEEKVTSLWLRQVGGHNQWKTSDDQLKIQSNRYIAQMGGDIAQWTTNGKDRLHVGLMAGYGNDNNRTSSYLTGYRSNGSVEGYSLGLYGTWYQNNLEKTGLYVDSWAQYNWFENKVSGAGLPTEEYDADGFVASIESGYAFKIRTDKKAGEKNREWFIEPKAQVVLMNVKSDEYVEENGTVVNVLGEGNAMIRIGARSYVNFYDEGRPRDGAEFQPFIEYNFIHNTEPFGVKMNDTNLFQDGTNNISEVKFGVESKINDNINLWGSIAVQFGSNGYEDNSASLGAKWVNNSTNQMEVTSQVSTIKFGGEKKITDNLSLTGDVGMQLGSNGRESQSAMLGMKYLIN